MCPSALGVPGNIVLFAVLLSGLSLVYCLYFLRNIVSSRIPLDDLSPGVPLDGLSPGVPLDGLSPGVPLDGLSPVSYTHLTLPTNHRV